ncbi:MAG: 50S ribosomal protein L29 [Nitrospiraceae bacterium]
MDVKDLRALTDDELRDKEQQLLQEQFNLRFQLSTGRLENPMQVKNTRRDVARIKTIRREAQLRAARGQAQAKG